MKKIFFLIAFVQFQFIYSQIIISDYPLSKIIEETSGLEIIGDYFITHNDSKGYPILYYLSKEGKIIKTREVKSAVNKDWEDESGTKYARLLRLKI
jgi:hypothetical protein